MSPETVMIRVRSRRASDRLKRVLGVDKLECYFNMWEGNNFVSIPANKLAEARAIPGITLARPKRELQKCWTW